MKVLFTNELKNYDSITSDNESGNYPAVNIVHNFLTRRYQYQYGASDQITIEMPSDINVDSVFWSYTNATQIDITLLDVYDTELVSCSFTNMTFDSGAYHFAQRYTTVRKIIVDIYAVDGAYLGGVAAGEIYDIGDPVSPWSEPSIDNSILDISPGGQASQTPFAPLRAHTWDFRDFDRNEMNDIVNVYRDVSVGALIWVDAFPNNYNFAPPLYAVLLNGIVPKKNGRRYDWSLSIQEAK